MNGSDKKEIRKEICTRLKKLETGEIREKSDRIKRRLFSSMPFKRAKVVMFYVSADEEVETRGMIREALKIGKRVVVPYTEKETNEILASELKDPEDDLEIGPYGIRHPKKGRVREIPLGEIDTVIVPGVAFDKKNTRLGRGKGYYDRFLAKLSPGTVTIGLCFDFQFLECLPRHSHDFPVSMVITN